MVGCCRTARGPPLFREAHAFVLPSRHESFAVVCAEAIASGRPVVATPGGGPESIVNQGNGLLVGVEDPDALAKALERVADTWSSYDPQAIRSDFLTRFSRAAVAERIVDVYRSVASVS